jgi:hypothetical protein
MAFATPTAMPDRLAAETRENEAWRGTIHR